MKKTYFIYLIFFLCNIHLGAKVSMPKFFSDNMVLQRDMPIKIWGKANKNEKVTVKFNGTEVSTQGDNKGIWNLELTPMSYGGPYTMEITGKDNTLTFSNVLIGDVWICSGQSNMEWQLSGTNDAEQEIKNSANKNIRFLTVEKAAEIEEQYDIKAGTWKECNPETSRYFSAVGYYFGKELEKELDIPIGLINTSWGGTDIQPWTSWESMQQTDDYRKYAGKPISKSINYDPKDYAKYIKALEKEKGDTEKWYLPQTSTKGWGKMHVPGLWSGNLAREDGVIWFRTTVTLPESANGKTGQLNLAIADDIDHTYINGTFIGKTAIWNERRIYPVKDGVLKSGVNTIIVKIQDDGGDGGIYGDEKDLYLEVDGKQYPLAGEWLYKASVLTSQYRAGKFGPNSFASLLYNGMVKPLVGYGIKGAIWYQGENNAHEAYKYRTLFPNMINDWRSQWGYEFPFFWVQLANYMPVQEQPVESNWAELREAQNMTLNLPKTGQAVITDIGEADDIHPRNKKDVGYRLALNALKTAYGKNIIASGPVYNSMQKQGDRIVLTFKNTDGGLTTKDKNKYGYVKGFSIAGADKKFVWAKAYIDGNNVVVFSDKVTNPVAVRYAWANNPDDNDLVNGYGLLASPFRTDDWPGITQK